MTYEKCSSGGSFDCLSGTTFDIFTDGSRIDDRTGFGVYIIDETGNIHKFSFRIHDSYSNNVAELCAIIYSLKIVPNNSTINIHSDSEISIKLLKSKDYQGMFQCLKTEYHKTIKQKNLRVSLIKVKGHIHPCNVIADYLSKKGAKSNKLP